MPCNVAGSAIAQGESVGRIDQWEEWNPTDDVEPLWLLLSGASDPPSDINVSDRRTGDIPHERSGKFLSGVIRDLANMEEAVESKLDNTLKNFYLTKSDARKELKRFFYKCKAKDMRPMLYYSGHGEVGTGNWCFHDGTISIEEIEDWLPKGTYYPIIFSDTCYSGHWANYCLNHESEHFHCLAACPEFSRAIDTKGKGGDLTLFMTGKKPRPATEPIYSGGNRLQFPITSGYDSVSYNDLIRSHVKNSQNILIYQCMHEGYFYGFFAPSKRHIPRPSINFLILKDEKSFKKFVREKSTRRSNIYSIACDENFGFGAFFLKDYGTRQVIVTVTGLSDLSKIKKNLKNGFRITSCAARGSKLYIVMTMGTKDMKDKRQHVIMKRTWKPIVEAVMEEFRHGYKLTGICYSSELRYYFVSLTEMAGEQIFQRFEEGKPITPWMKSAHKKGYHPTVIFKDPSDENVFVVAIKDEDRSSFKPAIHYKLK